MLNLPRIFRRAAPSEPQPGADPAAEAASHPTPDNPHPAEIAELDRLYQQALDVMNDVDSELNSTNELLGADADDDVAQPDLNAASAAGAENSTTPATAPVVDNRVTPAQIIEAALFVGGAPLTIKRLCTLLKGEFDQDFVEQTVEQLNRQYASEERPYEIRFGAGGYRMELSEAFESVQNRVFGIGPRDVKLGQEALEVLSLVAYKQPLTKEDIDAHVKENPANILRQLLQRELIAIRRDAGEAQQVTYHTTPRFLQVFGVADLSELPQSEELSYK